MHTKSKVRPSVVTNNPASNEPPGTSKVRLDYERGLTALCRTGRVHGLRLSGLHFRVLCFLLAAGPGYVIHQEKVAAELECKRLAVWRALKRLRTLGLVLAELIPGHKPLPWLRDGKAVYTRTQVCRYWVRVEWILRGSPSELSDGIPSEPSSGSLRSVDPSTPTPSRAPRRRRSPTPPASHVASETPGSSDALPTDSANRTDSVPESERLGGGGEQGEGHAVDELVAQWDALRMPEAGGTVSVCRPSERSAIRNRMREVGKTMIALAIVGAGANEMLRRGHARNAVAFVFRDRKTVDGYADRGRQALRQAEDARAAAAERSEREQIEDRRRDLWDRAPWVERAAPVPFREAMRRGDFAGAEEVLRSSSRVPS